LNTGYHVYYDGIDLEYIINLIDILYLTDCTYVKGVLDGKIFTMLKLKA